MAAPIGTHALKLNILAECPTTKARICKMMLPHQTVDTPVFMPVGTQGTLKGIIPEQLKEIDCQIILCNTYHLGHRPVSLSVFYCALLIFSARDSGLVKFLHMSVCLSSSLVSRSELGIILNLGNIPRFANIHV